MFKISVLCLFAAAAAAQQPGRQIMAGSATLKSGVFIRYRAILASTGASPDDFGRGLGEGGIVGGAADGIRREMVDRSTGSYFGYDLAIGPGDEKNGYLVTFRPLPEIQRRGQGTALKLLPIPKYPPPMIVHDGDTIALDLMASPDGKQKLTDYIEILSHEPEPRAATTTADPRDFTLDDGPVRFDAERITVWTNGQKYSGLFGFTGKDGATFWIAFPGQGRYILSLARHDGFTLSGTIRDNVASFRDGGQEYELRFLSPIAGAGKAWRLYIMHDPTYQPWPNQRNMIFMGTDRLENLLPQ
ncbi:MAG: hypothetical protein LAQ30_10240 [Acidobacteriia bacterium]|nr:hypothetical protein [Terriglobia bacterium]